MKAPDKIYLVETTRIIDEWRRKPSQYAKNIEYIRKDALLEWAKGQLATCDGAVAMQRAYDKLIDELNSL